MAKRCWIPRCCGVFLLSHQRLEPRSRSGSDAITLRAKSMNKLNRLSLVTGRTLYFSCYLFETLRSSKKTSMFTASLLYRLKKCSNGLIRSTQLQPSDSGARHVPLNLCSGVVHVPTKLCQAPPVRRCSSVQSCLKT